MGKACVPPPTPDPAFYHDDLNRYQAASKTPLPAYEGRLSAFPVPVPPSKRVRVLPILALAGAIATGLVVLIDWLVASATSGTAFTGAAGF